MVEVIQIDGWRVINLTPHDIRVQDSRTEEFIEFKKSGHVARLQEVILSTGEVWMGKHIFDLIEKSYQDVMVDGIPFVKFYQKHLMYEDIDCVIVSLSCLVPLTKLVADAVEKDEIEPILVVSPDTGPDSVIRDERGRIIGVRRFQCACFFLKGQAQR